MMSLQGSCAGAKPQLQPTCSTLAGSSFFRTALVRRSMNLLQISIS